VDTPIFAATLGIGFIGSWGLFRKKVGPVPAMLTLGLTPWVARGFIAFPWVFMADTAVFWDSLILNLDRNNFIALVPFYWIGFSTYFSARSRAFLQADIIMADTLLVMIFSIAPTGNIELYRLPILMIIVVGIILFFQILALIFSGPIEFKVRKKEYAGAGAVLFILVLIGGFLFLRPFQEKAVDKGGGLLAPKLFSFDFSQFLHLESEISINDDLVFIVRKNPDDMQTLLRRYVLSGYNRKQGFFRYETIDEKAHPQRLPERKTFLTSQKSAHTYRIRDQEYYLVNFDASAFIGMNEPVMITPFETWDASSFNAAYAVQSHVSEALRYELFDSVMIDPNPQTLGLSPEVYAFYTDYGEDERIVALARTITEGRSNYQDKIELIYRYLKEGDYRYSLKPGIASDGDQLAYFLFQSKKGYCSYYAFSMTLLLRSLGIPARVAAGFFIEPSTNTFNYYPVRSNMAHAWVEVCYPQYGWIEYDPTTELRAEGEEFRFSSGITEEFEQLLKEILDNHAQLIPKEGTGKKEIDDGLAAAGFRTIRFFQEYWVFLLLGVLSIGFILIRTQYMLEFRLTQNLRKKANRLWSHTKRRLRLGGYKKSPLEAEAEWVKRLNLRIPGVYELYQAVASARYGITYTAEQCKELERQYQDFSKSYAKTVSLGRRLLAWFAPPIGLVLDPLHKKKPKSKVSLEKAAGILLFFLFAFSGDKAGAQYPEELEEPDPQSLYYKALESQRSEHWEQAIELHRRGAERYPEDPRFPWALGELYFKRKLYGLAWDYYRKTETLLPEDPDLLYQLSRVAAHLNRDAESAEYLERLLLFEPDNQTAIGNLGWMYFKLHRLGEGRDLLLNALERLGPNPDFSMTLGMIFSDLFQYDDAKKWYLDAITRGEDIGDRKFTAVSHFNLSILETRFYQYDLAFERTNASLRSQNRASGRLARGELFLKRLEFKQAFSDYQIAYEIDPAPLSKVNLAKSYQLSGHLEEARLYAEDCLNGTDLSWMLNYGTDPVRYKRDIHEILYNVYEGLERTEYSIPYGTWQESVQGMFLKVSYWFKKKVHQHLFRKYSLLSADVYKTDSSAGGESNLDALLQYYNAFEDYPRRALRYLHKARDFEIPLIPESAASYTYKEGRLLKNWNLLQDTLTQFDSVWERDMIAEIYADLGQMKKGGKDIAQRLYALNRGILRQYGIRLPIELMIDIAIAEPENSGNLEQRIVRAIKAAGIDPLKSGSEASRFLLTIRISDQGIGYTAACELYDNVQGAPVFNHSIGINALSNKAAINAFIRTLGDYIFTNE
jgi:tetratricopeptide (TPR) repeat protein